MLSSLHSWQVNRFLFLQMTFAQQREGFHRDVPPESTPSDLIALVPTFTGAKESSEKTWIVTFNGYVFKNKNMQNARRDNTNIDKEKAWTKFQPFYWNFQQWSKMRRQLMANMHISQSVLPDSTSLLLHILLSLFFSLELTDKLGHHCFTSGVSVLLMLI